MAGIFVHFDRLNRLKLHRRLKTSNRAYMYVRNERMNGKDGSRNHESIFRANDVTVAIVRSRSRGRFERSPARELAHVGCRKSSLRICPPPTAFVAIILQPFPLFFRYYS